ncbi:MAG: LON peptidase substrate-binding domain-containing protein [Gammaproteobacteria bacterium]|nr:LON peptidase substrate-binding domain-containing protein [Gammaproteobacteria bacterium]MDH5802431.1 LON peptidase substrate-binding domain-containing protein [Gammaproteobacteria bacterium]
MDQEIDKQIPLFPLHTVLCPSGVLALKIFEPRYLEMISKSMKNESGFGICLIRHGSETGKAADCFDAGTLSQISYFDMLPGGLLHITATGKQRFEILSKQVLPNQLTMADVRLIANDPEVELPKSHSPAAALLKKLLEQLSHPYIKMEKKYNDCGWVSNRLTELLPIKLNVKQTLLQENDPIERINKVWQQIQNLGIR